MFTNYEDACEAEVTRDQARREIAKHSGDKEEALDNWQAFLEEVGSRSYYDGQTVLDFLGY